MVAKQQIVFLSVNYENNLNDELVEEKKQRVQVCHFHLGDIISYSFVLVTSFLLISALLQTL